MSTNCRRGRRVRKWAKDSLCCRPRVAEERWSDEGAFWNGEEARNVPGGELEPEADAGEGLAKQVDFHEACIFKHIFAGQEKVS
jgi:hypothetical protein